MRRGFVLVIGSRPVSVTRARIDASCRARTFLAYLSWFHAPAIATQGETAIGLGLVKVSDRVRTGVLSVSRWHPCLFYRCGPKLTLGSHDGTRPDTQMTLLVSPLLRVCPTIGPKAPTYVSTYSARLDPRPTSRLLFKTMISAWISRGLACRRRRCFIALL
jgi:flavin-binding protein dodecin